MTRFLFPFLAALFLPLDVFANSLDSTNNTASRTDSVRADTNRPFTRMYIGVNGTLSVNQRSVGITREAATYFGNEALTSFGINFINTGDLLFKTSNLRLQSSLEKFLNVYPSPRLLENIKSSVTIGYYVLEVSNISAYPFGGLGVNMFFIDRGIRLATLTLEAGAGIDYFVPATPLMIGLQASYNHAFNNVIVPDVSNNQAGMTLRAHVSIFLMKRYNFIGWE
jgi:hypothetical protein